MKFLDFLLGRFKAGNGDYFLPNSCLRRCLTASYRRVIVKLVKWGGFKDKLAINQQIRPSCSNFFWDP